MTAKIEVRVATGADAPELARMLDDFNTEFGDPTPGPQVLERRVWDLIADGEMTYWLGGEGPDGFAQVSSRPSVWSKEPVGYIEEFYVKPDRRGRGTGQAMMDAILADARGRGLAGMELCTGEDDREARALYEKVGFRNEIEGEDNARSLFYELEF